MHELDLSAVMFLAGAGVIGLAWGFVRPFRLLGTLFLAIAATAFLSPKIAEAFAANAPPTFAIVSPVFIISLVIIGVAVGTIRRQFWTNASEGTRELVASLRWLDRLGGGVVAAGFAFVFVTSLVYFIDLAGGAKSHAHLRGSELLRVSREYAPNWAGQVATKKDFDDFKQAFLREIAKKANNKGTPPTSSGKDTKSDFPPAFHDLKKEVTN